MKYNLFTLVFLISCIVKSQVGINTDNPNAMLDVNGDIRISNVNQGNVSNAANSVLVVDNSDNFIVKKVSSKDIIESHLKSFVKASLQSSSTIDISLIGDSSTILDFDLEEFDLNDEYDVATNSFSPKQNGYYEISSCINIEPDTIGVTTSTNVSLQILKNNIVVAESSGPLVGATLGLVNVYVFPERRVSTIISLTSTDVITFRIKNGDGLASIQVDLNTDNTGFFTIKQIR